MAFIDGIRDLFPHTVTVTPWTGQNLYGEATYGDPLTYQAKIEQGVDLKRAGIGDRSIVPRFRVFLAEPIQVDVRDLLTLDKVFGSRNDSGVFEAPATSIVMVKQVHDELEHVCTILYCG
jgi:hypothetical protein